MAQIGWLNSFPRYRQAFSDAMARMGWLNSIPRVGGVGFSAVIGAAFIIYYCQISFEGLVQLAVGGVAVLVFCICKAPPPSRSNGMPVGNNAPTATRRGGEEGNYSAKLTEEFTKLGPKKFFYEELRIATDSFATNRELGRGVSGIVYRGYIGEAHTEVAVKKITLSDDQGITVYKSEVKSLSQLRHKNLVTLIGYCHEGNQFALVYEFIGGGTLSDHLFGRRSLLTWERRYNIALGLASALRYLHKQCHQCVIHRDIKSSNIMLHENFMAKLGDFGFAKLVDQKRGPNTTQVVGTLGYLDPEYFETGTVSKESDIYSFGIVLLEIVCGRRVLSPELSPERDPKNLAVWVWKRYGPKKLLDAVDSRLSTNFKKKQAKALMIAGLWCAHPNARYRPSIEEVIDVLNLKAEPRELPPDMPPYFC